jgi:hypothetical protein
MRVPYGVQVPSVRVAAIPPRSELARSIDADGVLGTPDGQAQRRPLAALRADITSGAMARAA